MQNETASHGINFDALGRDRQSSTWLPKVSNWKCPG